MFVVLTPMIYIICTYVRTSYKYPELDFVNFDNWSSRLPTKIHAEYTTAPIHNCELCAAMRAPHSISMRHM